MSAQSFLATPGNGGNTTFSIDTFSQDEIKVYVNEVLKQEGSGNDYQISNYTATGGRIDWVGTAPTSNDRIRIVRQTKILNNGGNAVEGKATYSAGAAVKATDLNNNTKQVLRSLQEHNDQLIQTYDIQDNAVTSAKILDGTIVEGDIANSAITSNKLADNAVTATEIINGAVTRPKIAADAIDETKLADNAVNSEHYVDGSIDAVHLSNNSVTTAKIVDNAITTGKIAADAVNGTKIPDDAIGSEHIQDDVVNSEHIAAGALDNEHYAAGSITSDKLNGATVITSSEQGSATTNDTSFLTSAAADARFFNISSGDTIKDGQTFPDNDTTIATTAAINDRIIDLIDDVGGFDIIQSEQHFPDTNPQGTTGQAAVLSIKAATTNLVPSGTTVTISNGNLANNANIIITGVTSTIPTGFGFLVESTSTTHTYAFHRLVPKATEVTTVASNITNINNAANNETNINAAVSNASNINAAVSNASNITAVAGNASNINAAVSNASNINAAVSNASNITTTANSITNVNNVGNNITNVNSVSNSAGANQTFTVTVQNVSGNKYFIDGVQTPVLKLARGKTYTFDMSDSSNSGHPLAFRDSSDNSYTTGVTTSGTAGSSGATVVIVVAANAPSSLKYYCTSHGNAMGNTITVIDDNVGIVAGSISNVNTVGGSISNVNTTAGSISNVNTVATNINAINDFTDVYRVGSQNPTNHLTTGDLFFNTTSNSLKVYTGSAWVDGVTATGNFAVVTGNTFTGSNVHNDNVKSIYGTNSDGLEIYHDGNHSYVEDTGTGNLFLKSDSVISIRGTTIALKNAVNSEALAIFSQNGAADLYYDNSKKFETTSGGATVTGRLSTDGVFIGDGGNNDTSLSIGANNDLRLYHDGSNSYVLDRGTGNLIIAGSAVNILNAAANESMIRCTENAQVELYHNNTKMFETTADGATLQKGLTVTGVEGGVAQIRLEADEGDNASDKFRLVATDSSGLEIQSYDGSQYDTLIKGVINAGVELSHNNSKKFETTSSGVSVTGNIAVTGTVDGVDIAALNTTVGNITTDVVSDTSPQLGGPLNTNGQIIKWPDSSGSSVNRAVFGAGNDLQIYHDGTHSYLSNGTGNLFLEIPEGKKFQVQHGTEAILNGYADGRVELYHNNVKKFETTSGGVEVTGDIIPDANNTRNIGNGSTNFNAIWASTRFRGNDNVSIQLGNSIDFKIRHDGTDNLIEAPTGADLKIMAGTGDNANETCAKFIHDGGVELYHNNSKKFETTSAGCTLTGSLTGTGHVYLPDGGKFVSGASNDLQIYHDGSESYVKNTNTNSNLILEGAHGVDIKHGGENMAKFRPDAAVELYYDNSKKIETSSSGVSITGGAIATGNSAQFRCIESGGATMKIQCGGVEGYIGTQTAHKVSFVTNAGSHSNAGRKWTLQEAGHFLPYLNNTYDIGSPSYRVRNIYTNDLHLSNEGHQNDVDGTWGDWTMQEGESDLFLKNNRSGKKYKFNLTEVS